MKKYLAAAVVAVMVFAFAAFAASVNVNDSTLASGVAEVQGCDGDVDVIWQAHESAHLLDDDYWWVNEVTLEGFVDCDGEDVIVVLLDANDQPVAKGGAQGISGGAITVEDWVLDEAPVGDVHKIAVLVKQLTQGEIDWIFGT